MTMYYAGIDLGTSSVGWALTDENYKIIRKKGKDLWGVRLFDEASTAVERRNHRTARRRRRREIARIGLLKSYFADAIHEVDTGFFERLEESKYHLDDKKVECKYALFNDKDYTDKEYYKQYPTIFHLRNELIKSKEEHDVRLVYLAILNIFKHRGHFLSNSLDDSFNGDFGEVCDNFHNCMPEELTINIYAEDKREDALKILCDKSLQKREKADNLMDLLHLKKNQYKAEYEIIKMMCGLSGKVGIIFESELRESELSKQQLSFRDSNFEEKLSALVESLADESVSFLESIKEIHDHVLLRDIMKGCNYLSEARIISYEKHKDDLKKLQHVIKKYANDQYDDFFRIMSNNNYSGYVGFVYSSKAKERRNRTASDDDFFKAVKKLLERMPEDDETVQYLKNETEKETLLPKQLTFENGVIPNQVHLIELKEILLNAESYLPFLNTKDESGLTVSERIIQLFKFQMPYYVGPINIKGSKSENSWAVRKEEGRILPWNVEDKINIQETREAFIMRMVRQCTYISGEKCLPKNSLMYEKYMVLNELNNLQIHGQKVDVKTKQDIFNTLFKKGKRVTRNDLLKYLIRNGIIRENEQDEISGIDENFSQGLISYGRFQSVIGEAIDLWEYEQMAEQIIFWGTVYSNDKKIMAELIIEKYGPKAENSLLSKEQIKRILGFKWKDWGRFSGKFLELQGRAKSDGETMSLLEGLWAYNDNLMALLSEQYTYRDALYQELDQSEKLLSEFTYDDLNDRYLSAPVKRMVWQTILIMKELCQVMGEAPEKIFVEMPREHGESGKRTTSRKKKFEDLYKQCGKEYASWQKEIANMNEDDFRVKKMYLYYTQMGRCMYTGEAIDLDKIGEYDIDHIYPRHYVKDDSLDNNLVLVRKESNGHKKDDYPIEGSVRKERYLLWRGLLDKKLITQEKFNRLTRSWEFSDEELAGFISRQIVETGQATKQAAHILEELIPESKIIYVKAGNVSAFRQRTDLLKSRAINDFHHAKDAYLNIVVGNTYDTKFTQNPLNFIKKYKCDKENHKYHMYKIFDYDVERNGNVAWKAGEKGSIIMVKKMMGKNTPLLTKRTYEQHGGIADQTIYSAKEANKESYIPVKAQDNRLSDVTKYGGMKNVSGAYYFLVEHEKKNKKVRSLEQVPVYLKTQLEQDENALLKYCRECLGLMNPNIRVKRIPFKSLVKREKFFLNIAGKTGVQILVENAMPMCFSQEWESYIKHLENFALNGKEEDLKSIVSKEMNGRLYEEILYKHKTIYLQKPNSLTGKLTDKQQIFDDLNLKEQVTAILEILKNTLCKNLPIAIKELDLKASPMKVGKEISGLGECLLIHQSVTGIYETVIDLKTV